MKVIKWIDEHLEEVILVLLVSFISCSMMLQVIMRFVFKHALPWPEELSQYSLVLAGFISIPYCVRKGNMIRIDLLPSFLPKAVQKGIDIVLHAIMIAILAWLFYGGYGVYLDAATHGNATASLRLPLSVIYGIGLGFIVLGMIRMIQHIILLLRKTDTADNKQEKA